MDKSDCGKADFIKHFQVPRETVHRLEAYAALLAEWNEKFNLVAASTMPQLWTRHFLDSAQLTGYIPSAAASLVDMGSGAGLPGLIIAILCPQLACHLIESTGKKADFLRLVAKELALNVVVRQDRIEAIRGLEVDIVTARALKALPELLSYAKPLLKKDLLPVSQGSECGCGIDSGAKILDIHGRETSKPERQLRQHPENRRFKDFAFPTKDNLATSRSRQHTGVDCMSVNTKQLMAACLSFVLLGSAAQAEDTAKKIRTAKPEKLLIVSECAPWDGSTLIMAINFIDGRKFTARLWGASVAEVRRASRLPLRIPALPSIATSAAKPARPDCATQWGRATPSRLQIKVKLEDKTQGSVTINDETIPTITVYDKTKATICG